MWSADADRPVDGGALWPVELESIDCKLQMSAPSGNLQRGTVYSTEYTALSRAQ